MEVGVTTCVSYTIECVLVLGGLGLLQRSTSTDVGHGRVSFGGGDTHTCNKQVALFV